MTFYWTDIPDDRYVANMDQAMDQSGWTTYAAVDQKRTSLTVNTPHIHKKTVDISKTCQSHVAKNSVHLHCFTALLYSMSCSRDYCNTYIFFCVIIFVHEKM